MKSAKYSSKQIKALSLLMFSLTAAHLATLAGLSHWLRKTSNAQLIVELNQTVNAPSQAASSILLDSVPGRVKAGPIAEEGVTKTTVQRFDPNHAEAAIFRQFGISQKVISNIIKYRNAGGYFKKCEDLKKIYGFEEVWLEAIQAYCNCADTKNRIQSEMSIIPININSASADSLQILKGIGPVLSSRIIKYRDRLGGFNQIEQLKEVYGVQDSLYDILQSQIVANGKLTTIDINTATFKALIRHFYIDYNTAKAIINYRDQHGEYEEVEELQNIISLSDSVYQRIFPYLSAEKNDTIK
ncbi:MAG: helix-hairpin-helix domain-containing protein [Saprospiraceae bacterium]|nr:helix-hairpin-helix domain-containing protein [Saprospiraceae bacterium]